jgi:membrane protein implicated in regulation of membrane protease activity
MARFLIFTGLILLVAGLLWPYIAKLGLGHLPGDIVFKRGNTTFYFPIVTSIVLSAVLWLLGRRAKRQTNKR